MNTIVLFRPVGKQELDLIEESGWRKFPPRLPEQPIFYPVMNEEYAIQINVEWNVPAYGAGFVTMFHVNAEYLKKFEVQNVGMRSFKVFLKIISRESLVITVPSGIIQKASISLIIFFSAKPTSLSD